MSHFRISDLDRLKGKVGLRIFFPYNIILLSLERSHAAQGFWARFAQSQHSCGQRIQQNVFQCWDGIQQWDSIQLNKIYVGGITNYMNSQGVWWVWKGIHLYYRVSVHQQGWVGQKRPKMCPRSLWTTPCEDWTLHYIISLLYYNLAFPLTKFVK